MSDPADIAEAIAGLEAHGYRAIPEHRGLHAGARVHNRGEQYSSAYLHGTATVVAVFIKEGSSWARQYGRPDVEVVINHDNPDRGAGPWADYGTALADNQPSPTNGPLS